MIKTLPINCFGPSRRPLGSLAFLHGLCAALSIRANSPKSVSADPYVYQETQSRPGYRLSLAIMSAAWDRLCRRKAYAT